MFRNLRDNHKSTNKEPKGKRAKLKTITATFYLQEFTQ